MKKVLFLLMAVVLSACTAIPTDGPVVEVPHSAEPVGIDIAPQPPAQDAVPARVVDGFLQALVVPGEGFRIARQYLTEEASAAWEPTGNLAIYEGTVVADTAGSRVLGSLSGTLDHDGRYEARDEPYTHDFGLVQVDGQWRIGNPPEDLLLSRYLFERYYSRLTLYYISRIGSHVVPDPIYVHETLATPTAVLEGLFRGPSDQLSRVVTNALPGEAELGPAGATIDARGVVTVDLVGLDNSMSDDARRRLGAQLLWSLTSLPRVSGLVVTRGDLTFALPGATADGILELATQQGYQVLSRASTTDLFAVKNAVPGRIVGEGSFERWSTAPPNVADLAVSIDGASVAMVDDWRGNVAFGALNSELTEVQVGLTRLRSPQFSLGTLWVLGYNLAGVPTLATVDRSGRVTMVDVDLPAGAKIEEFAVSPTRARIALVIDMGGENQLGMASLIGANPVTLRDWKRIPLMEPNGSTPSEISSVAWQAETGLAIAATMSGQRSIYTVQIDGSHLEDLGSVSGEIVELAAMARLGGGAVAIRTSANIAWRYEARTRWTRLTDGIEAVAYGG